MLLVPPPLKLKFGDPRSEEHTSELQSRRDLVCRLLLAKKKFSDTTASSSKQNLAHIYRNVGQFTATLTLIYGTGSSSMSRTTFVSAAMPHLAAASACSL